MRLILKFFWQHIRPYRHWYALMMCAPILSSFFPLIYNYAIKDIIDILSTQQTVAFSSVFGSIVLFLSSHLLLDCVWRISGFAAWQSEPFVRRRILLHTYDQIQHYSYGYFQNHFTGTINSKMKSILDGYDKLWTEIHHGLILRLFKITVNVIALIFVNTLMGWYIIVWIVCYCPIMYHLSKRLNALSFHETETRHRLLGLVSDRISNIFNLFAFASRQREYNTLQKTIDDHFIPAQKAVYRYDFKMQLIGGILYFIVYAFLIFYMIYLRSINAISMGDFSFVFGISLIFGEDVWQATISMQDFTRHMGDLRSALGLFDDRWLSRDPTSSYPLIISQPTIEFRHVCFNYDQRKQVLNDFNLHIEAGEKVGIVGCR